MYIPPEGIYFRLMARDDGYYLYSRNSPEPVVWHYKGGLYDDQLFSLIHGTVENDHPGLYAIKGKVSGKVLFSRTNASPHVGNIAGDGAYNDNWFKFEQGTGEYEGAFRILCPATETVIFSRTSADPKFGNFGNPSDVYGDQFWLFIFEDMVVDRIEYDIELAKITNQTPDVIAEQKLTNTTNHDQEMSFGFLKTVTETSKFEYATGFTLAVGAEFSVGIPLIAEGQVSVSTSTTNTWTFGRENTFTKTYSANFPVKAGPKQSIHAKATVQSATLSVPYTLYLSSKTNKVQVTTSGTWKGLTTWNLDYAVSPA